MFLADATLTIRGLFKCLGPYKVFMQRNSKQNMFRIRLGLNVFPIYTSVYK